MKPKSNRSGIDNSACNVNELTSSVSTKLNQAHYPFLTRIGGNSRKRSPLVKSFPRSNIAMNSEIFLRFVSVFFTV